MAKLKTIHSASLLSAEQALEKLFSTIPSPEVQAELRRWLDYGRTRSEETLRYLSPEQLSLFLDKLPDLLLAIYCQQQEDQKGGRP
ncbi:hypothetical protein EOD41_16955 [Mucilaginibacter limnophilus]|uniref:Uncharacterized protein n=1 Tax=Mucilaginibacter limnophilus TaxID=1932778 RepID=A0A3S2UML4_9SPHI|nr:hypothetical protein [Mucilaginibacter limnophilus]RVT98477.1 hypothetical protein EOD41_16955 [Mucilaginibacter limnophilus]